jgi:hypothetical protein
MQPDDCPDCAGVDRRDFLRVVGGSAAALTVAGTAAPGLLAGGPTQVARQPKPAEALIQDLYTGMTAEQRRTLVLPWDHRSRQVMANSPINGQTIGQHYTRVQQELIERILRSISSGDGGFRQLTRGGNYDTRGGLQGCGVHIFGEPGTGGRQYAWVFTGHHLTVRCDGNSQPDAAFGGPMFYGHSPDGHSQRNVFNYQTRAVSRVFEALSEAQRRQAVITSGGPGEGPRSVQFRREGHPGLVAGDLTADQRRLVETVMREILSPYRTEDADEVIELVRRNGGLERLHLAFYLDRGATDNQRWHFWRLEGPGFVWNYRVLPHVHCYVNIARAPQA